ncbi:mannosyltransferase putative-domain-containing protein [Chytriomyces sp. MP71]|nr:mannosyltransferase putative-domain-containing protein [Chytriomyces sp. MP71]
MGRRARALHITYRLLYDRHDLHDTLASYSIPDFLKDADSAEVKRTKLTGQLEVVVSQLSKLMYPWLVESRFKSLHDLQTNSRAQIGTQNEMGLIFSTGRGHFELAVHAILSIRNIHKCTLPIEVHHMGPNDLDAEMIVALNALPGVKTVDIWTEFGEEARQLGGWAIKPFALLASRFTKAMVIDADSVFIQSPEVLFKNSNLFAKYGQIFYHDRTITGYDWCYNWFNSFVPSVSKYTNSLRFQSKRTVHEQESGVVLVDKSRSDVLHGLLTTCKMNMKFERDGITYKKMHGDKESYWMSWELARVPYKFSTSYGGTIGYKNDNHAVCGGLFHTDEYLKPLWWNGGVVANKHIKKTEGILHYEHMAYDLEGQDIQWEWETTTTPFCLKPKFTGQKVVVVELNEDEKRIAREMVDLYKKIVEKGWMEYFKSEGIQ